MQATGILLVLINVVTIAGPVVGVAVVYQNNLTELVVPPELTQVLNCSVTIGDQTNLAQVVNVQINNSSRTLTLTVAITNPVNYTLTLNSFSANVECSQHNFVMGSISLVNPVALPASQTTNVNFVSTWTAAAEDHFRTAHPGASTIDLNLVGLVVDVNGVNMSPSEPVGIPNVPIV
jgi:hypothetical protein